MTNEYKNVNDKVENVIPFSKESIRIIIAGGGTGGHIFPAIAIANALKKIEPDIEILFVGAKGKMEMDKIPEAGYKIVGLTIAGYNRSSLMKNIALPFKLVKSFFEVTTILKKFKPAAVIGVGGYSSFPVLRIAQTRRIPTFIHESNSLPGKSNVMLSKRATEIFVATEKMERYFPANKTVLTGNPVREIFSTNIPKDDALKFFGLKAGMKTIFIMGGSLGAKSINETIAANIDAFKKNNLQLIWQTGKLFAERAAKVEEDRGNIWTNAFITKMEYAYNAADIVVARAGAMTIAELCVVGKPAIFVPYPFAAEDHQAVNAMALVQKDAAVMVRDEDVKTNLMTSLLELASDGEKMEMLESNIAKMGNSNADEIIAKQILKNIKH
ncbi:MAG TPA: undecaprenyldiphospho-muramoylpentapeptide beta-N-acetylglucosaminyltransferase [Chitinophagaceae bacterium]|nr:undecaprenyldiphospho-muramoylpentapeptide beta-N-acetylglucosaminyltransferase [Chitinophagaceae bacterium]